ncbi:hypothetical protein PR048_017774 [Dryococelus australis]|uniref:Uncharacterized protein n=1 Tax=Dryococelus australis TaxID=614101 RepID=A0ABQ9HAD7_9NEOP|nr:hypothetical protein PR048_017774 [Dryococelus australis]
MLARTKEYSTLCFHFLVLHRTRLPTCQANNIDPSDVESSTSDRNDMFSDILCACSCECDETSRRTKIMHTTNAYLHVQQEAISRKATHKIFEPRPNQPRDCFNNSFYSRKTNPDCQTTRLPPRQTGFDSGGVAPRFSHVRIMPDDAAGWRVFSEISFTALSFRRCSILISLHHHRLSRRRY